MKNKLFTEKGNIAHTYCDIYATVHNMLSSRSLNTDAAYKLHQGADHPNIVKNSCNQIDLITHSEKKRNPFKNKTTEVIHSEKSQRITVLE